MPMIEERELVAHRRKREKKFMLVRSYFNVLVVDKRSGVQQQRLLRTGVQVQCSTLH